MSLLVGSRRALLGPDNPNLIVNPSFVVDTSGWVAGGVGSTITRATDDAELGPFCVEISASVNAGGMNPDATSAILHSRRITAQVVHLCAFDAYLVSGASNWQCYIQQIDDAGGFISSAAVAFTALASKTRHTFVATPLSPLTRIFRMQILRASAAASVLRVTNVDMRRR